MESKKGFSYKGVAKRGGGGGLVIRDRLRRIGDIDH